MSKSILCVDFDGVLHSYTSGWQGADMVSDPPVPGAMEFLSEAVKRFEVHIFSSRSHQEGGRDAMQAWLWINLVREVAYVANEVYHAVKWPTEKPSALVTIDDRAITFTGTWPSLDDLINFKPWNKRG